MTAQWETLESLKMSPDLYELEKGFDEVWTKAGNEILNGMRSQRISLPENQVFLIGFYQLSPKFREWLDFLNFRKVSITFLPDQLKDEKNKKSDKKE